MSRPKIILFVIAVVFGVWNVYANGLSLQSGLVAFLILFCLAINVYTEMNKQKKMDEQLVKAREKEEIRQMRAEKRRQQSRKHRKKK